MAASPQFTDSAFDRTPPFSIEAETAVLGAALIDKSSIPKILDRINEGMFYREANRRVFRAMVRVFERAEAIDVVTLAEELKKTGEMEAAGGYDYISALIDAVPTSANVGYHAGIVRDKAMLRGLVEACSHVIRDVYDQGERSAEEIVAEAEQRVLGSTAAMTRLESKALKDYLWGAFEQMEKWQGLGGKTAGLSTGFPSLDKRTTGMHPGELWVVAGRPSMGKTSLTMNIATNVAMADPQYGQRRSRVWIKSLEMDGQELTIRLIASECRIDLMKIRRGEQMTQEEHQRLALGSGHLNAADIIIDEDPIARIGGIRAAARRLHHEEPLDLIVVDYLQLIEGTGKRSRVEDVSDISRGLKLLARELRVPVIAVSQLSRGVDSRTNKRPVLSDLRDSGSIEQDADVVCMVYRPEYYMTEKEVAKAKEKPKGDPTGVAEIIIPKQRNGPTGTLAMHFEKSTTRFLEWRERF